MRRRGNLKEYIVSLEKEIIKSEFEGVFLCQQLKLKTLLSHIMAM